MKTKYIIYLQSRDGQKFEGEFEGETRAEAELKALGHMKDIGYDMYEYRVVKAKVLDQINK